MSILDIQLPHNGWTPRPHQMALWSYLRNGGKRAVAVWHRRCGKDEVALHHTAMAMQERGGTYWHCNPEYAQARKSIWDAINPHTGRRRIDEAFPVELRENTRDHDMFIRMRIPGGGTSTWQCIGSDQYDRTVGSSCAGLVMSELALSNPAAWAYFRPMLQENGGWACFITTPRGKNHAFDMFNHAQRTDGWFAELLTAKQTGALTDDELNEALEEYKSLYGADYGTAQYRQEYLCDWAASIIGSFWGAELAAVRSEGRMLAIEPDLSRPIDYAWDLGIGDDTAIWTFQAQPSGQLYILDHYATSGAGLDHFAEHIEKLERERGWTHGTDFVPHDAKIREWGSGRTRVETMQRIGLKPYLVPLAAIDDGINAVRRVLPLCVFHPRTERGGFDALEQYRREWDEEKRAFRAAAVHDWTSHPADAFRYLAMGYKAAPRRVVHAPEVKGWTIPPPSEPRRGGIRL
jgi:hypothetical protein